MKDFLIELNFTEKQIGVILDYCRELDLSSSQIREVKKVIEFLLKYGIPKDIFVRMLKKEKRILTLTLDEVLLRIQDLETLKYEKKAIVRILCPNAKILTEPIEYVTHIIDFFMKKKVKANIARGVVRALPSICDYTAEQLNAKLEEIEAHRFTEEQALNVITHYPLILKKAKTYLPTLIEDIMSLDFSEAEAIELIVLSRVVIRAPRPEVMRKISLLTSLGLKEDLFREPYALVPGLETMHAIANFLIGEGYRSPEILRRHFFKSGKKFKTTFLRSPQELVITYRVSKELEIARKMTHTKQE